MAQSFNQSFERVLSQQSPGPSTHLLDTLYPRDHFPLAPSPCPCDRSCPEGSGGITGAVPTAVSQFFSTAFHQGTSTQLKITGCHLMQFDVHDTSADGCCPLSAFPTGSQAKHGSCSLTSWGAALDCLEGGFGQHPAPSLIYYPPGWCFYG